MQKITFPYMNYFSSRGENFFLHGEKVITFHCCKRTYARTKLNEFEITLLNRSTQIAIGCLHRAIIRLAVGMNFQPNPNGKPGNNCFHEIGNVIFEYTATPGIAVTDIFSSIQKRTFSMCECIFSLQMKPIAI